MEVIRIMFSERLDRSQKVFFSIRNSTDIFFTAVTARGRWTTNCVHFGKYNCWNDRVCLTGVVNEIKAKLADNVRYLDRFDMKLYKYGYRKNHENEYQDNQFRFIEKENML